MATDPPTVDRSIRLARLGAVAPDLDRLPPPTADLPDPGLADFIDQLRARDPAFAEALDRRFAAARCAGHPRRAWCRQPQADHLYRVGGWSRLGTVVRMAGHHRHAPADRARRGKPTCDAVTEIAAALGVSMGALGKAAEKLERKRDGQAHSSAGGRSHWMNTLSALPVPS